MALSAACARHVPALSRSLAAPALWAGNRRPASSIAAVAKGGYRLVATDLDGTFMRDQGLPPWQQIPSPINTRAVRKLIDSGIYFMPISGRMIANMDPLVTAMGSHVSKSPLTMIAGYNGGLVVKQAKPPAQWEQISNVPLSRVAIECALEYATANRMLMKIYYRNESGCCAMASCYDFEYSEDQANFFYGCGEFPYTADDVGSAVLNPNFRAKLHEAPFPIHRVKPTVDTIVALNPLKLVLPTNTPDADMAAAAKILPRGEADLIRGNFWFEYMPPKMNKSAALSWVAEHLGFTIEECVAFGDSSNDLEMVRDAGLGVAMSNARDDVKALAKYRSIYSNEEDAVGREIEALLDAGAFATIP